MTDFVKQDVARITSLVEQSTKPLCIHNFAEILRLNHESLSPTNLMKYTGYILKLCLSDRKLMATEKKRCQWLNWKLHPTYTVYKRVEPISQIPLVIPKEAITTATRTETDSVTLYFGDTEVIIKKRMKA